MPYNTSSDPGHPCDSSESNTFRALRLLGGPHGNRLYAEFTRVTDWHFAAADVFVEIFDLDADPGQLSNLAERTPEAEKRWYRDAMHAAWTCAGDTCP